jgi:hypothetical protein
VELGCAVVSAVRASASALAETSVEASRISCEEGVGVVVVVVVAGAAAVSVDDFDAGVLHLGQTSKPFE